PGGEETIARVHRPYLDRRGHKRVRLALPAGGGLLGSVRRRIRRPHPWAVGSPANTTATGPQFLPPGSPVQALFRRDGGGAAFRRSAGTASRSLGGHRGRRWPASLPRPPSPTKGSRRRNDRPRRPGLTGPVPKRELASRPSPGRAPFLEAE